MTLELAGMYHIGLVVADLDQAMESYARQFDLTWAPLQHRDLTVRHRGEIVGTDLRFTYSREGPVHLELIEAAAAGTPWEPADSVHHVGFWADDLEGTGRTLQASGLELDTTYDSPSGGIVGFGYFMGPSGLRIEVVDGARRSGFDDWLAGGDFPAAAGN